MNQTKKIFDILNSRELTLSFCESASAGTLTSLFCELDGVSKVFKGSIIAYSNEVKTNLVKIPSSTINQYGAVSEEVALLMAKNTNKIMNTDICLSITGNASAISTIESKPSCFYFIGIALFDKTYSYSVQLDVHERNYNRLNISINALDILLNLLYECDK
ncbi:MAG: CinA family protein [Mycoplasma sp.]